MSSLTEIQDQQMNPEPGMSTIKAIDQDTIKFIAAGEKINDIETAIRELVENSIDAGARNIEVQLARFGVDAIEVKDDGSGIDKINFDSLGQRYYTSKIKDFKKLQESLETFGFRGEAISCLCNVSNLTIMTKAKSSPTGWKLVFSSDGSISKLDPVGRDNGTTVIVKNLFHSLPVRRRELEISAKKQYDKVVRLIYEQVLARPAIKFSLCKKNAAKKEKDFTHGGTTLQGALITIFGVKTFESLVPIRQKDYDLPNTSVATTRCAKSLGNNDCDENSPEVKTTQEQLDDTSTQVKPEDSTLDELIPCKGEFFKRNRKSKFSREKPDFKIYGYISNIGAGRNSTDCQYLYVNNKPCEVPKLSRLINEIYRGYSRDQSPFYCLFIQTQSWVADFNVPRKRQLILQEESKLCDIVRETLEEMFSHCVPASQKSCPVAQIPLLMGPKKTDESLNGNLKRPVDAMMVKDETEQSKNLNNSSKTESMTDENDTTRSESVISATRSSVLDATDSNQHEKVTVPNNNNNCTKANDKDLDQNISSNASSIVESIPDLFENPSKRQKTCNSTPRKIDSNQPDSPIATPRFKNGLEMLVEEMKSPSKLNNGNISNISNHQNNSTFKVPGTPSSVPRSPARLVVSKPTCRYNEVVMTQNNRLSVRLDYLEDVPTILDQERHDKAEPVEYNEQYSFAIHPKFNAVAEEQLKLNLNKNSFKDMKVLGQFNMGFIIARLSNHIFIIDQHATDERANYEDLLTRSPLERQEMIHPKPLFLNLIQENAILNNIQAFKSRGFELMVDTDKPVGYRVMLRATSICKDSGRDVYLGKDDIEELIDVIIESPNRLDTYTLKKVREVAASMACRKSVMIGDSLSWEKMENIVEKMTSLQNPWICAHNRPTIRHLMETDWIKRDKRN